MIDLYIVIGIITIVAFINCYVVIVSWLGGTFNIAPITSGKIDYFFVIMVTGILSIAFIVSVPDKIMTLFLFSTGFVHSINMIFGIVYLYVALKQNT